MCPKRPAMPDHILVPCKSLRSGKSRLADMLSAAERERLCADLLRHTIGLALAVRPARQVRIVTPDQDVVAIAAGLGVAAIEDDGTSLNAALERGRAVILGESDGSATATILPIDLPHATAADLDRALATPGDVIIAPDAEHRGTNLLHLGRRALPDFRFAFGRDSCAAHRRWGEAQGLRVAVVTVPRLAFDLDRPEDYARWRGRPAAIAD